MDDLVPLAAVLEKYKVARQTLYRWIAAGVFPQGFKQKPGGLEPAGRTPGRRRRVGEGWDTFPIYFRRSDLGEFDLSAATVEARGESRLAVSAARVALAALARPVLTAPRRARKRRARKSSASASPEPAAR